MIGHRHIIAAISSALYIVFLYYIFCDVQPFVMAQVHAHRIFMLNFAAYLATKHLTLLRKLHTQCAAYFTVVCIVLKGVICLLFRAKQHDFHYFIVAILYIYIELMVYKYIEDCLTFIYENGVRLSFVQRTKTTPSSSQTM